VQSGEIRMTPLPRPPLAHGGHLMGSPHGHIAAPSRRDAGQVRRTTGATFALSRRLINRGRRMSCVGRVEPVAGWIRRRNPSSWRFITADHDPSYELGFCPAFGAYGTRFPSVGLRGWDLSPQRYHRGRWKIFAAGFLQGGRCVEFSRLALRCDNCGAAHSGEAGGF
jgi:hypothetical protein